MYSLLFLSSLTTRSFFSFRTRNRDHVTPRLTLGERNEIAASRFQKPATCFLLLSCVKRAWHVFTPPAIRLTMRFLILQGSRRRSASLSSALPDWIRRVREYRRDRLIWKSHVSANRVGCTRLKYCTFFSWRKELSDISEKKVTLLLEDRNYEVSMMIVKTISRNWEWCSDSLGIRVIFAHF